MFQLEAHLFQIEAYLAMHSAQWANKWTQDQKIKFLQNCRK